MRCHYAGVEEQLVHCRVLALAIGHSAQSAGPAVLSALGLPVQLKERSPCCRSMKNSKARTQEHICLHDRGTPSQAGIPGTTVTGADKDRAVALRHGDDGIKPQKPHFRHLECPLKKCHAAKLLHIVNGNRHRLRDLNSQHTACDLHVLEAGLLEHKELFHKLAAHFNIAVDVQTLSLVVTNSWQSPSMIGPFPAGALFAVDRTCNRQSSINKQAAPRNRRSPHHAVVFHVNVGS